MSGAIIIGAGPGIRLAVARRFARAGLPIGVVARSRSTVDTALAALAETDVETYGAMARRRRRSLPARHTRRACRTPRRARRAVAPGTAFDPDAIAEEYWRLQQQPPGAWDREVLFTGQPHSAENRQTVLR